MAGLGLFRDRLNVPSLRRDRTVLALVIFVVLFAQVLLYPGVADLVGRLGATGGLDASTWFLAVEFLAFVVFAGPWGALSDRVGRRAPFIVFGAVGSAIGYAAIAVLGGNGLLPFEGVLVLRFLQGTLTVAAFSLAMTMLTDLDGGHGRNMGAAGIAIGLGTALGAPVGGGLSAVGTVLPLWVASGGLLLAGLLALGLEDRVPSGHELSLRSVIERVRASPALGYPFVFGFVDRLTAGFFALIGTAYFRDAFGLDAAAAGIMLGLFFAPFALLQYPLGVFSDTVGRKRPIVLGSLAYGIAILAVYLAPTPLIAGGLMVTLGIFGALISPATMALVGDLAGEVERGVAMGGFNVFGNLGFLAGMVVGSVVTTAIGYAPAFVVVGALEAGIVVVTLPRFLKLELPDTQVFSG
ncbi:MFS transporter [Halorhabdus rudnickae]|uniref:MFS transporter n=1 Tax=Halorhabdus rudnickae TaxID=1775544 RepID=UPI0037428A3E